MRQEVTKRQRTNEPDGTDALSSTQSVEGAPPPAAAANVGVLDVLIDCECIVAALQTQSTVDALALLLALSLVSVEALECVTRACTQLCDAKHAHLLHALLPPAASVSMSAGDEDRAVQDILWNESRQETFESQPQRWYVWGIALRPYPSRQLRVLGYGP